PDKIISARVAADLPEAERTNVEVMATSSEAFASYAKAKGAFSDSGRTQDICALRAPTRVVGDL
ncbi:MAG: peptidylprolyl isomerase, partial [Pseudomonadota bacterium]